ncbi:helix-turn-helix domain-containing protein [Robbsia sp. Bb-Pol-6]|uniref:Helix-turn-helix domain-containing protein n=1 Tax=Robbsia betulipollinis TaxID=2981849 RepID=A0ABT3ZRL9_9BURK|nr:helix-turn-helix domain-containing protein [Robbsia betulipollinis]MCY0389127.1 helix-turn-helix domain-containing protein [Robbsia betulipollinis]
MEDLKVVRVKEAAAFLHATPQTVRIKARAGLIPGRKVGKHWIFSLVALHRYLCGEWEPAGRGKGN